MSAKNYLKRIANVLPPKLKNKAYRASAIIFGLSNLNSLPFYDMYYHIANLKKLGFHPDLIIDAGALYGQWTENVKAIFPEAAFIMIEPQIAQKKHLDLIIDRFNNVSMELSLLGDVEKDGVDFYEMGTGSSIYQENSDHQREKVSLKMETLDALIEKKYQMPSNCFIKLDVQGAEIDVLRGATELLKKTEFILLEISILNYNYKAPQFTDVIIFLKEIGFVLFDICDERRMKNDVLYQIDMIFVKESSAIRSSVNYKDIQ
jgi:FkbM family methyltransferase